MDFEYRWTNKAGGRYAIRKTDAGKKGTGDFQQAGKEIERIKEGQTSKTHFFLAVADDFLPELFMTNRILKTVTYEYVYEGTGKKAVRRYLSKRDFEKIFDNIKAYENGTAEIPIAPPKKNRKETEREKTFILNGIKECFDMGIGTTGREKLFELVGKREAKGRELAKGQKAVRAKILKLQRELKEQGESTKAEIETIDREIHSTAGKWVKDFDKTMKARINVGKKKVDDVMENIRGRAKKAPQGDLGKAKYKIYEKELREINWETVFNQRMLDVLEKVNGMLKPAKQNRAVSLQERIRQGTKPKLNVANESGETKGLKYGEFIEILTSVMKTEKQRTARNERQKGYRADKNNGVRRPRGRPRKK